MVDTNEHTGSRLVSKVPSKEYQEGWDRIFGNKQKKEDNDKTDRIVVKQE